MKNTLLLLLSLAAISGSISTMENNQSNPGEAAIKNHPNAWLATKIVGGATGGFFGLFCFAACAALSEGMIAIASRDLSSPARTRLQRFKMIALSTPFIYGGYK